MASFGLTFGGLDSGGYSIPTSFQNTSTIFSQPQTTNTTSGGSTVASIMNAIANIGSVAVAGILAGRMNPDQIRQPVTTTTNQQGTVTTQTTGSSIFRSLSGQQWLLLGVAAILIVVLILRHSK